VFFARVRRALELIDRYDQRSLERIRRDIGPHHYDRNSKFIALSWPFVLQGTAADLAMTIIHEATHHRIAEWGIAYDESLRGRIEAVCVGPEVAFARRLPGGESLAESELKVLERPWWTPEGFHRSTMVALRAHDAPAWVLRLMDWIGRRRLRRKQATASAASPPRRGAADR
jgi:hypothetical protein